MLLKLLSQYNDVDEEKLPEDLEKELHNLEVIAIRYVVCGSSTKNFNKNCADLLADKATTDSLILDRQDEINDTVLTQKLKSISNKNATLLLFWLELKRRHEDSKCAEKDLKYCYTLEHIMPQKWHEYWPIDNPSVKDENGQVVTDIERAEEIRAASIYEIGNMALLDSKLNTSISFNRVKADNIFFIYLAGYHNTAKQAFIQKIAKSNPDKNWFHFGDIDPDGFYILEHLKNKTGIDFKPLYMSVEELKKYKDYCKSLEENDKKKARSLITKGLFVDEMQYILENNVKLEQEVVSWKQFIVI